MREQGKSVLVLDTLIRGDAARLYARVGTVPRYALMPTGEVCGTTFYWKAL